MNPILRNILAVFAGVVFGSVINMSIIMLGGSIIPPPEGADVTTMEGLKASMHLFQAKHFLMPFLAHSLGTLAGAFAAAYIAINNNMQLALIIGLIFMAGGIMTIMDLPSPLWYTIVDVVGAYLPFAYLGGKLAMKKK